MVCGSYLMAALAEPRAGAAAGFLSSSALLLIQTPALHLCLLLLPYSPAHLPSLSSPPPSAPQRYTL